MNLKIDTVKFVAPALIGGALMVAFSSPSLENEGAFNYKPNPGAMARSPYGRTVGMALQGPVNRFWDRGVGSVEGKAEMLDGSRPDEKLFNFLTELREEKSDGRAPKELRDVYQDYAMARIEKKLEMAWNMDPRNFGNYAIYQMFLWEGFNRKQFEPKLSVRDLSLATLEASLADRESPVSLLTAAQASYDLIFEARTSKTQDEDESIQDINTYSKVLPQIISDYDDMVVAMKSDGRWDQFSEVKRAEFAGRRTYLEKLNNETEMVVEKLTKKNDSNKGGSQS